MTNRPHDSSPCALTPDCSSTMLPWRTLSRVSWIACPSAHNFTIQVTVPYSHFRLRLMISATFQYLQTLPHDNALSIGYHFMLSVRFSIGSPTGGLNHISSCPCRTHTTENLNACLLDYHAIVSSRFISYSQSILLIG